MTRVSLGRLAVCGALATALAGGSAAAQDVTGRAAVEAVVSASVTSKTLDAPFVVMDAVTTFRIGHGWDAVVRPWVARMTAGDWHTEMYQMQVRYVSSTRVPFRVDAGIISSPLGLATFELRADRNPTIGAPFYYYVPLPPFDGHFDGVTLMSGGYPLGAVLSASGSHWDARAGVTDSSPTLSRSVFSATRAPAMAQVIGGAGVTPIPGFRLGVGFAQGRYRAPATTPTGVSLPGESATVFNVEGEYSIGYTRVAGEWIADRFDTTKSPALARGFNLDATRTLNPRWFVSARTARTSSPTLTAPTPLRLSAVSAEGTLGYRLTRSFTLRGGYQGSRMFKSREWQHAAAVSMVWAQRWW